MHLTELHMEAEFKVPISSQQLVPLVIAALTLQNNSFFLPQKCMSWVWQSLQMTLFTTLSLLLGDRKAVSHILPLPSKNNIKQNEKVKYLSL